MPLTGLTKRRIPYADIVQAEAPMAKNAYFARLARDQAKKAALARNTLAQKTLTQQASQAEDLLAANKEQFRTGLTESQRQFQEQQRLQQEQAAQQAAQAQQATGLATIGLGVEAYPYLKEGASGLGNLLFAESAPATTATTAGTTGLAAGETAGGVSGGAAAGSEAGGGMGAAGNAAAILAIIAGQDRLANLTNTEFEGQKTGGFFSTDDQGRWAPRFGNEPWHGFLNQQWGAGPSAGEKWDAAMYNGDLGLTARRTPAMVQQWLNPVGDFGYDIAESKWGKNFAGTLDPLTYGFDRFSEAEDIGDAGKALVDTSAKVVDPVGTLVGPPVKDFVSDVTGSTALGEVANFMVNPIGSAADFISNWF